VEPTRATGGDDDLRTIFQSGSKLMAAKRPPLPLILTANELFGGDVVYFSRKGWSPDRADAFVATDEPGAEALEAALEEALQDGAVIDPYLIDAGQRHYRERIRLNGPTVAYGEEALNVSL
jgi:hypothetical protein